MRTMASSFLRFLDHAQRRITGGRTPLDAWSARRRDLYLTSHNTHNRQTSMPPVGFEPTISAGELGPARNSGSSGQFWTRLATNWQDTVSYIAVFRDVTPYILIQIWRRFGGIYCLRHNSIRRLICPEAACIISVWNVRLSNKPCCISSQNLLSDNLKNSKFHVTISYST